MTEGRIIMDKETVILKAVDKLKKSEFGTTAIKVELEAQLNRGSGEEGCEYCIEGMQECGNCDGYGEYECHTCEGNGCLDCREADCENEVCSESHECPSCDGVGRNTCEGCDGDGRVTCEDCDGNWGGDNEWSSEHYCQMWIMERLSHIGLAEEVEGQWKTKLPLRFIKFYNDGSVDSELTFTIMLNDPNNILLLPKFIEIFNDFAEQVQGDCEIDVEGAGMHMALLNEPNGNYPNRNDQQIRWENFARSTQLLMPALYFLASDSDRSRGLGYRRPEVGFDTHRSAIDYRHGALEFRVFNTCYDNPETILDNVVVMANMMRYWSENKVPSGLTKITSRTNFGNDNNHTLERFYTTTTHIDLLNAGLAKLKPSYYTIGQLKTQRGFKISKHTLRGAITKRKKEAEVEYREYADRFDWSLKFKRYAHLNMILDNGQVPPVDRQDEAIASAEKKVDEFIEAVKKDKLPVVAYVERAINEFNQQRSGQFILTEGE